MVVEEAIKRCVTAICDDLVSLRTVNRRCHNADELSQFVGHDVIYDALHQYSRLFCFINIWHLFRTRAARARGARPSPLEGMGGEGPSNSKLAIL